MHREYPTAFYFSLTFTGRDASFKSADVAFQEVSGITKELKLDEVGCGGENRFKYRLPTGTTFQNLILKRGVLLSNSPLFKWCSYTLDTGLVNPIRTQDVDVNLLNASGTVCMSWSFVNAYPVKWSVSDLKSQENAILIETMELAYNYFELKSGGSR